MRKATCCVPNKTYKINVLSWYSSCNIEYFKPSQYSINFDMWCVDVALLQFPADVIKSNKNNPINSTAILPLQLTTVYKKKQCRCGFKMTNCWLIFHVNCFHGNPQMEIRPTRTQVFVVFHVLFITCVKSFAFLFCFVLSSVSFPIPTVSHSKEKHVIHGIAHVTIVINALLKNS